MKYILAIDQSTQGTKAILTDENGKIFRKTARSHRQIVNEKGWISHDAEEIYSSVLSAAKEIVSGEENNIAAIGITNQRETSLCWYKSGKPTNLAVVWQCGRAKDICDSMTAHEKTVKKKTGLPLSPYFSAAKLSWLMQNTKAEKQSDTMLGTVDSYLIYRLTGNYKTDFSNASRTQLFNINTLEWDKELCDLFGIDINGLSEVCASDDCFGYTDLEGLLPNKIPIHAVLGDSHAAFFAQGCTEIGSVKATYGTGSSVMMNTGESIFNIDGLAASVGFKLGGKLCYVLEGNIAATGASISWLKDNVRLIASPNETEELCVKATKNDGLYFIPAFSGLGAPYWNENARGMLYGISRTTGRAEIVRAAAESIAYSINDVISAMRKNAGIEITSIKADGGATENKYLMQFQSDISDCRVTVSIAAEMSALGAAFAAGIKTGIYPGDIYNSVNGTDYFPLMNEADRRELIKGWNNSVSMVLSQGINKNMDEIKESVIFPLGELVSDGTTKGFMGGKVYNHMFVPFESEYNCPLGNVTYAPCARNGWHIHPGGQVLLITGGRGWYQEEGSPAREVKAGDCVLVPPGVKHWHGASKDSFMSHIGLITNTDKGLATAYEHVSDEEYDKLP